MLARINPGSNPYVHEKAPQTGPDSLFILQIEEDVRPALHGPFNTYEESGALVEDLMATQGDAAGAIFTLLIQWPERVIIMDNVKAPDTDPMELARQAFIPRQYRPTAEQLDEEARYL